ncbi:GNAT family N-acetyltransferase [Streptomyces sp. MAR4 CNY-716]
MVLGKLVRLRAFEPPEADALWRWNHDPDVMRWMDDGYAASLARVRRRLEERAPNAYDDVLYAVEVLADGALIGLVRLRDAEPETGLAQLDVYLGEKTTGAAASRRTRCARCAASASRTCGCTRSR